MAKILSKSGISSLQIVRPGHVTQSVDAFTGTEAYDVTVSGSLTLTGSMFLESSSQTSPNVGNVLTYDISSGRVHYTSSTAIAGTSTGGVAGNNYDVQFNSASTFGASSDLRFIYDSSSLIQGPDHTLGFEFNNSVVLNSENILLRGVNSFMAGQANTISASFG